MKHDVWWWTYFLMPLIIIYDFYLLSFSFGVVWFGGKLFSCRRYSNICLYMKITLKSEYDVWWWRHVVMLLVITIYINIITIYYLFLFFFFIVFGLKENYLSMKYSVALFNSKKILKKKWKNNIKKWFFLFYYKNK